MADDKRTKRDDERDDVNETPATRDEATDQPNPPRTTAGGWTSPKFGSAGSGGAELEPGPERD